MYRRKSPAYITKSERSLKAGYSYLQTIPKKVSLGTGLPQKQHHVYQDQKLLPAHEKCAKS